MFRLAHALAASAAIATLAVTPAHAQDDDAWPFPDDVPTADPVALNPAGQWPPDITRLLMVRGIAGAELSADGNTLAFRTSVTGEPQLWVVDAQAGWPRQLTYGGSVSLHDWVPGEAGGALLYGADREGDERFGLSIIAADGAEERVVLPYSDAFVSPGAFSPDGTRLAFSTTARNGTDYDIHELTLTTGETREVYQGRLGNFAVSWRPDSDEVLVSRTRGEDGNDLYSLDMATGELTQLFAPEISSAYEDICWRPDGSGFYLITDQDREHRALAWFDAGSSDLTFIAEPETDVDQLELAASGAYLIWTTNDGGYSGLHAQTADGEALTPPDGLPVGVYSLDAAHDAAKVAITVSGPRTAGDVYVWDLETGALSLIAQATRAGIDLNRMVIPESLDFPARDGVQLNGLLYMPEGASEAAPPPVLVRVHGGPTAQARPTFRPVEQYLVANGIAVFDLNFRGSTGFGKTFARLDNQFLRRNGVTDIVDAVAFLGETGRVDASRAAVMGGSYGGYLTNAVVGEHPDVFKAGVSFVGVSDWVRALETASPGLKASDVIEYGDISDPEVRAFHADLSPINRVNDVSAAMMLLHGANDPRDPVAESDEFVRALRENGQTVEYLRFPDEGHGIRKLENRITAYRRVVTFLKRELGVTPQD